MLVLSKCARTDSFPLHVPTYPQQKGAKREHEEQEVKVPFKVWFPEWFHHKSTGPDDPDRYMGTRTAEKWGTY